MDLYLEEGLDRCGFYLSVPEALPQAFSGKKISSGRRPRAFIIRAGLNTRFRPVNIENGHVTKSQAALSNDNVRWSN